MKKVILLASLLALTGCADQTPTEETWLCTLTGLQDVTAMYIDYKNQSARIFEDIEEIGGVTLPILVNRNTVSLLAGDEGQFDLEKIRNDRVRVTAREDPFGPMTDAGTCVLGK